MLRERHTRSTTTNAAAPQTLFMAPPFSRACLLVPQRYERIIITAAMMINMAASMMPRWRGVIM
jgi:hypothetical protein